MTATRTYADPVEVVAEAIDRLVWEKAELGLRPGSDDEARTALEALKQHGFLSPAYFDAIKARSGK